MEKLAIFPAVFLAAMCAFAEKQPFERYESIIERMPFGQPPDGFDPTRNPDDVPKNEGKDAEELSAEQQELQKQVQFSVINVEEDGDVLVGFTDKSDAGAPRHYYLRVGEERGGWLVKEADPAEKSMVIEKDGIEIAMKLGENSTSEAKSTAAKGRTSAATPAAGKVRNHLLSRDNESFTTRRARKQAEEAQSEAERKRIEEERRREREEQERKEALEREERAQERAAMRDQLDEIQAALRREHEERLKNGLGEDGESNEDSSNE